LSATGAKSRAREKLLNARPVKASAEQLEDIAKPLPEGCPVQPLGMESGPTPTAVYLSASGIISKLSGQAHGQGNREGLFAPHNRFLWEHWPRRTQDGASVNGFKAELVRADLFAAAGQRGIWDELERVRGPGAWRGAGGELILHLGDRVLMDGELHPWGVLDGMVYPAGPAMLGPSPRGPGGSGTQAAHQVLGLLQTWNWRHPSIAPRLMLGWICAAMIGGALKWRPAVWPTGDRGTGKSTLLDACKPLLGPNAAVQTANTTAAGIRQAVMARSVPVLLDELEANDDGGDVVGKVIELLRQASSGSIGLRGGADHKGQVFQIRSAMLATSIMVPPLRSQDRSRIAVLDLRPLDSARPMPDVRADRLHVLGQQLLRRMVDGWPELGARLETWRAQLEAHAGMDARGADQYGTLLACADLALSDQAPDGELLADVVGEGLTNMLGELRADDVQDWRRAIDHMLTAPAEAYRGGDRLTLGELVGRAAGHVAGIDADDANKALAHAGLRVVVQSGLWWLAVANQHQHLSRVYQNTIWAGRSGTSGGWRQVMLRAPGALVPPNALRFGAGVSQRVVMLPLLVALNSEAP
jgi:hypothetical protein